jgi:O-antigen/teichoic acid export membrane protein
MAPVARSPAYVVTVLALGALSAVSLLFDAISVALRRSEDIVRRNIAAGVTRFALIGLLWLVLASGHGIAIALAWVGSVGIMCGLALRHIRRLLPAYRPRLTLGGLHDLPQLLRNGLANHALTLAVVGPQMVLPLVVVEVISPAANAYWYAVWIGALLVRMVPASRAWALFSEVANAGEHVLDDIQRSVRVSIVHTLALAAGMAVAGPIALHTLGAEYAEGGGDALRILSAGMVFLVFTEFYIVVHRARRRLMEPIVAYTVTGVLLVAAAIPAGAAHGLDGVAVVWVVGETAVGLWAAYRLRRLVHRPQALDDR